MKIADLRFAHLLPLLAFALAALTGCREQAPFRLVSPDGDVVVIVETGERLTYSVAYRGERVVDRSAIALCLEGGDTLGAAPVVRSTARERVDERIDAPLYRQPSVEVRYNKLLVRFDGDYAVEFRAYDEGCAYRFVTSRREPIVVEDEVAEFRFDGADRCWAAYSDGVDNAFQFPYDVTTVAEFRPDGLALTPLAVGLASGVKVLVSESDLRSYPGMMLTGDGGVLRGTFARLPDSLVTTPRRCQLRVVSRHDCIARTEGSRTFPWRLLAIGADTELPVCNLVYALGEPSRVESTDWIAGGKAAWEWWNDYCLADVDFTPGVNTATYEAYIDFAADYGLEYVILDEGWSDPRGGDVMRAIDDVDLDRIIAYGRERGVGVFLWAVANVLDDKLEEAMAHYAARGVKGFKVDFFDRDDQLAVEMVYRIAEAAARHRLMVDLHGMYKPTGLERTFPNIVNFEGVFGMEEFKWANPDMMAYDVTFPYIRMAQGAVDYTSGGYRNATREGFRIDYRRPMTQGTRTHQAATFVVFDQPLAMLCESPSLYRADAPCTEFIAAIPTRWDRTRVLAGRLGEYIVTARERDGVWYVGGLTDWTPRSLELDCSFLDEGAHYEARVMRDVADDLPTQYSLSTQRIDSGSTLRFDLASGGGFALIIRKL